MKKEGVILFLCFVAFVIVFKDSNVLSTEKVVVEEVTLGTKPSSIKIKLNADVPYKVIQVDDKEVLIALKNAWIEEEIEFPGGKDSLISRVNAQMLADDVVAFVVNTKNDVLNVKTSWIEQTQTLLVVFDGDDNSVSKDISLSAKKVEIMEGQKVLIDPETHLPMLEKNIVKKPLSERLSMAQQKKLPTLHSVVPIKQRIFSGDVSDMLVEMASDACSRARGFNKALILSREKMWQDAFSILDDYITENPSGRCTESAFFLRAYDYYQWCRKQKDDAVLLKGTDMLQEVITLFPKSPYLPYAFSALGQLYLAMGNKPQTVGYFDYVLDNYKEYHGKPELLYILGCIDFDKGKFKDSIEKFYDVIVNYPASVVFQDSRIKYGEALFKQKQFINALDVFKDVVEKDYPKIYDSPDLLLSMGNAYYELEDHEKAGETLLKVYNLFPDIENKDIILTKVGDSYAGAKHIDKAISIYRLVTLQYPDTEGFVLSSMRLADIYKDRSEKEKLYNMIIKDYPENPLALQSMIKIAMLQFDAGELKETIVTLETLLSMRPGILRYDALLLMSKAYEVLYEAEFEAGNYPAVLANYETHKRLIDHFENKRILLIVGKSYLEGHLFEQAFMKFMTSYKLYNRGKRPSDLIYNLAVSMYELDRSDEAINMFKQYIRNFPKDVGIVKAYTYLGKIRLSLKQYKKAIENFKVAFEQSVVDKEKAYILIDEADGYVGLKQYKMASTGLVEAVKLLTLEPEKNKKKIFQAYKKMGDVYFAYNAYVKAAEAFSSATRYTALNEDVANMQFLTGNAYEKGKIIEKAVNAFNEVVLTGDSFWGSIAQERLQSIELAKTLSNT